MSEKELLERSIYLETTTALSRFEVMKKKTLLDIDFLINSILRKKYIIGEDIPETEVGKIESLTPAFRHLRDNMLEEDKAEYLAEIAIEEERLAKLKEFAASLEEDIKKSKKRLSNLEKGILPGETSEEDEDKEDDKSKSAPAGATDTSSEFPTAGEDKDKDAVAALLAGKDGKGMDSEFPTAGEDKDKDAVAALLAGMDEGPEEVASVVKPKEKLWVRIARMIGAAAAFVAAVMSVTKIVDRPDAATYQKSSQEKPWEPIRKITPVEPISSLTPMPEARPVTPYTPTDTQEPDVTPTPVTPAPADPTPVTPTPVTPEPQNDEFIPPVLKPGEAAYNAETGVERHRDGSSAILTGDDRGAGDHAELGRTNDGDSIVYEEHLGAQQPAPEIPRTGDEISYEEFMDNATPEEARVVNEAIVNSAGVDWDALMADEEMNVTLNR